MEDLINSLSSLIYYIAREFTNDNSLIEELYNQGVLGIYDAYSNYDKKSNTKFSSYAYMYIYGKMYNYINQDRNIKVNKDFNKLYKLIVKTRDYLCQIEYKDVSYKEVANYLNIDESLVNLIINASKDTLSLDYDYDNVNLSSFVQTDSYYHNVELDDLFDTLDEEEKNVIYFKYFSGYSQSEIAKIMNMSQSGVSRCEKKSIEKMRARTMV